jgi:hypothetical protein
MGDSVLEAGRGLRRRAPSAAAVLAVILVAVVAHLASQPSASQPSADTAAGTAGRGSANCAAAPAGQATSAAASPPPASAGLVRIGGQASGAPRSAAVADMLSTYFSGINHCDYRQALSVFSPVGKVDPTSPAILRGLARGLATTTDSDVVLQQVLPAGSRGHLPEPTTRRIRAER